MNKQEVLLQLQNYGPTHDEDRRFRQEMIEFVQTQDEFASRYNFAGHLTASAMIVDQRREKVLLLHHRKLNRWLQPGGHVEADASLLDAALREALEETGLQSIQPISNEIFDLDIHPIPARKKDPKHNHLDVRYLLEADLDESLAISEESNELAWFDLNNLEEALDLEWSVLRMVAKVL